MKGNKDLFGLDYDLWIEKKQQSKILKEYFEEDKEEFIDEDEI